MEETIKKQKLSRRQVLHLGFDILLVLKGILAFFETLVGFLTIFLTPARMGQFMIWLTKTELTEDPEDWLMHKLLAWAHNFTTGTQEFLVFYLLSHGIIKFVMIILLWKKKLWAYPVSIIIFSGFVIYQIYDFTLNYSLMYIVLTVIDIFMIWLTILEYRNIRSERHA